MKRFFALLLLLSAMVCANAQVWYYVDSKTDISTGSSSRGGNGHYIAVIVKDSYGDLWMIHEYGDDSLSALGKMKDAFSIDPNFYVNAFNHSKHPEKYINFRPAPDYNNRFYSESRMSKYPGGIRNFFNFNKLKYIETMQKCYIYEYNHGAKFQVAIGKDFQTIITDPDTSRPLYFTNYSPSDFISHRNADDLF